MSPSPILPKGHIVAIRGPVVDVQFGVGKLPPVNDALHIDAGSAGTLVAEVQSHIDEHTARTVALQTTSALNRGAAVEATGAAIMVPVGDEFLGRLLTTTGNVGDGGAALQADVLRRPIHRPPPALEQQSAATAMFETGIKVLDLLSPLAQGGKAAMFGGASVGKTVLVMELIDAMVARYSREAYFGRARSFEERHGRADDLVWQRRRQSFGIRACFAPLGEDIFLHPAALQHASPDRRSQRRIANREPGACHRARASHGSINLVANMPSRHSRSMVPCNPLSVACSKVVPNPI